MDSKETNSELAFLIVCLKHTENLPKPNFAKVAEELGGKASTHYHRHWRLIKKLAIVAKDKDADGDEPSPVKKRGRPRSTKKTKKGEEADEEHEDESGGKPAKKAKTEAKEENTE